MCEPNIEKDKYQAQKDYYNRKKDDPFTQEQNTNKNYHYYHSQSKSEDPKIREVYRLKRQEYAKRAYLKRKETIKQYIQLFL